MVGNTAEGWGAGGWAPGARVLSLAQTHRGGPQTTSTRLYAGVLAFADGSKLFVATRDLSPTIFHFKEKWKQLFDLGILGGATGRGRERGGDRSAAMKLKDAYSLEGKL